MQVITITGNLGKDAETRQTQRGEDVCSFSVAVKNGTERDAPSVWYRCSVWGQRGKSIATYLRKGTRVSVVGSLIIGEYQGKPQYDVRVAELDFTSSAQRQEGTGQRQSGGGGSGYASDDLDDEVPFATTAIAPDRRRV
jgi:single-strand DNA-binding protein